MGEVDDLLGDLPGGGGTYPDFRMPKGWRIVADSNEALLHHRGYTKLIAHTTSLWVGDYSIVDPDGVLHDRLVTVERKSLDNMISDVTADRERYERSLAKMQTMLWKAIVIEGTWAELGQRHRKRTRERVIRGAHPHAVMGSVMAWAQRFSIPTYFAGSRHDGEHLTEWILAKYARDVKSGIVDPRAHPAFAEQRSLQFA